MIRANAENEVETESDTESDPARRQRERRNPPIHGPTRFRRKRRKRTEEEADGLF